MKARFAAIGGEPLPGSAASSAKLIAEETGKWAKVVRAAASSRSKRWHARSLDAFDVLVAEPIQDEWRMRLG